MRTCLLAALLCLATVVNPADTRAQVQQRQETTVSTEIVPLPPAPEAPRATTGAATTTTTVRTYTYQPVCELRREQFADENGWRVRDVRVCR